MENTTNTYTCDKCGKERAEADGAFTDEAMKKFCCEQCCKTGDVSSEKKEEPAVCEFC